MQVVNYSDSAIAVYGETKPWVEQLKNLGGKYNRNLKDGPGWIFSLKKKDEVDEFVKSSNNVKLVKDDNLHITKITNQSSMIQEKKNVSTKTQEVSFPSVFTGPDNLQYQIVMYTVVLPHINQKVMLVTGVEKLEFVVSSFEKTFPISEITIQNEEGDIYNVYLISGKWKIRELKDEHQLIFS